MRGLGKLIQSWPEDRAEALGDELKAFGERLKAVVMAREASEGVLGEQAHGSWREPCHLAGEESPGASCLSFSTVNCEGAPSALASSPADPGGES